MSWNAYLSCRSCNSTAGDWNYTHNTNDMIAAAYESVSGEPTEQCGGSLGPVIGPAWWNRLDGTAGPEGAAYLAQIVKGLEADPERFRRMNPENGWGSYDSLLDILREMRDKGADASGETAWSVSG